MTPEQLEAYGRLKAWMRDFGHEKQPVFVEDMTVALNALESQAKEIERYRKALENIRKHQEVIGGKSAPLTGAWYIADMAIKNETPPPAAGEEGILCNSTNEQC